MSKQILTKSPKYNYYAFFDVDNTLVSIKTLMSFLKFYNLNKYSIKFYGLFKYLYLLIKLKIYQIFNNKREFLNLKFYQCLRGENEQAILESGKLWFKENLQKNNNFFNTSVLHHINEHKNKGAAVVLISGSFNACLNPISLYLDIKHVLTTNLELKNGRYTGTIIPPQTIGKGKVIAIHNFLKNEDFINLEKCYAYGDHISDLPLLETVGIPIVVAGDCKLKKIAVERGWKFIP